MPESTTVPSVEAIKHATYARQEWGLTLLQKLIGIDSVAPGEAACQEALYHHLRSEGLPARLIPLDEDELRTTEGFIDTGLPLEERPNLVVSVGGKRNGRSLILNSHIDTVSWHENRGRWEEHPLHGGIREGKIYGRGAVDAKGQVMTAVMALLILRDLGYEPAGRLIVESVVGEEPDGNGTLALCQQGWTADAAIVLEPTDNKVAYGHRGIIGIRFHVEGQAGHAAVQNSRANAILAGGYLAGILNGALEDWASPSDVVYGPPSLNVGRIQGGENIFTVPQWCTIDCGVRYAPKTYDDIVRHIQAHMRRAGQTGFLQSFDVPELAIVSHYDAADVSPDSSLVRGLLACIPEVDSDRQLVTFPGGCDARHFINRYEVPTVIFGPGQLAVAHAVDEYLPVEQWLQAVQALALFIVRWCG